MSSTLENLVTKGQHVTNYIVTGKETLAFKDEGGVERLNAIGQRKVYKGTLKEERGLDDKYATTDNMEKVDLKRLDKKREKEKTQILQKRRRTVKKCLQQLRGKTKSRPVKRIVYSSDEEEPEAPQSTFSPSQRLRQSTPDKSPLTSTPVRAQTPQAGPSQHPPSETPPDAGSPRYVIAVVSPTAMSTDDDLDKELMDESLYREKDIPPFEEDDILGKLEAISSFNISFEGRDSR